MSFRGRAAAITLALTAALAAVLALMGALHTHWLGYAAFALFFAVLLGRAVVAWGIRGTAIALTFMTALGAVAFLIQRLA